MHDESKKTIELDFTLDLQDDFNRSFANSFNAEHEKDIQFWRRAAYHCFFAALEAWIWVNKSHMIPELFQERGEATLKRLGLDRNEQAEEKPKSKRQQKNEKWKNDHPDFFPILEMTVAHLVVLSGGTWERANEVMSGQKWEALKLARDVRNRLSHPKVNADIRINDLELAYLHASNEWYLETFQSLDYSDMPSEALISEEHLVVAEKSGEVPLPVAAE